MQKYLENTNEILYTLNRFRLVQRWRQKEDYFEIISN